MCVLQTFLVSLIVICVSLYTLSPGMCVVNNVIVSMVTLIFQMHCTIYYVTLIPFLPSSFPFIMFLFAVVIESYFRKIMYPLLGGSLVGGAFYLSVPQNRTDSNRRLQELIKRVWPR